MFLFLVTVCAGQTVWATPSKIEKVSIHLDGHEKAVFRIQGNKLPGFQIYSLGEDNRYAIDLPGVNISDLPTPKIPDGLLLHDIIFEQRQGRHIQNPRALLIFNGPVEYAIKGQKRGIAFEFNYLGEKKALITLKKKRFQARTQLEKAARAEQSLIKQEQAKTQKELQRLKKEVNRTAKILETHQKQLLQEQANKEKLLAQLHEKVLQQDQRHRDMLQATQEKREEMLTLLQETRQTRNTQQREVTKNQAERQARLQDIKLLEGMYERKSAELEKLTQKSDTASHQLFELRGELQEAQETLATIQIQTQTLNTRMDNEWANEKDRKQKLQNEINALVKRKKNEEVSLRALTQAAKKRQQNLVNIEKEQKELEFLVDEKTRLQQELHNQSLAHKELLQALARGQKEREALRLERQAALLEKEAELKQKRSEIETLRTARKKLKTEIQQYQSQHKAFLKKSKEEKELIIEEKEQLLRQETHAVNLLQAQRLKLQTELQLAQNEKAILLAETEEEQQEKLQQKRRLMRKEEQILRRLKTERVTLEQQLAAKRQAYIEHQQIAQTDQDRLLTQHQKIQSNHQTELKHLAGLKAKMEKEIQLISAEQEQQKKQLQNLQKQETELSQTLAEKSSLQAEQEARLMALSQQKKKMDELLQQRAAQEKAKTKILNDLKTQEAAIRTSLQQTQDLEKANEKKRLAQVQHFEEVQKQMKTMAQEKHHLQKEIFELRNQKQEELKLSRRDNRADTPETQMKPTPNEDRLTAQILHFKNQYWQVPVEKKATRRFGGLSNPKNDEPGRNVLNRLMVVKNKDASSSVGVQISGGAKYSVKQESPTTYIVELLDTRAGNLKVRRILDASDIDASVVRLLPHVEEDGRHRVSLRIELRHPASLQTDQDGTLLWLKFMTENS
ncbi:MAG: hypothetical protein CMH56_15520 [Myxococcales bacterium]|nr:hypothetical protein [Myxococcales bacterium]